MANSVYAFSFVVINGIDVNFQTSQYHLKTSTNLQSRILYLGYICGLIGYVVAMSGVNMHEPRLIFWIYTAIIYKYTQLDKAQEEKDHLPSAFHFGPELIQYDQNAIIRKWCNFQPILKPEWRI